MQKVFPVNATLTTMNRNLIPTPIVDRNGKQTTVHKKAASVASGKALPVPSLKSKVTGFFSNKEKAALTTAIGWKLQSLPKLQGSADLSLMMRSINKVGDTAYLVALNNVLDRVTEDEQDREFLYDTLIKANATDNIRAIRVAGNHLDVLEDNPGSLERLYRLDLILDSYYGDVKDPVSEVDTLETHLRAKLDYPYLGDKGYSIEYEMSTAYFRAIQDKPELAEPLMQFVRTCGKDDLTTNNFDLFVKIHEEMPEHVEKFMEMLPNRGINDLLDFIEDRGYYEYNEESKGTIAGYFDSAKAISEGWL